MSMRHIFILVFCTLSWNLSLSIPMQWDYKGPVMDGMQFDVEMGQDGRFHIITSSYYELDENGKVLVKDTSVGDERQGSIDFAPAIGVGKDGDVHIVTRHGGSWKSGHQIRYRKRSSNNWRNRR